MKQYISILLAAITLTLTACGDSDSSSNSSAAASGPVKTFKGKQSNNVGTSGAITLNISDTNAVITVAGTSGSGGLAAGSFEVKLAPQTRSGDGVTCTFNYKITGKLDTATKASGVIGGTVVCGGSTNEIKGVFTANAG